jgi:hypothetical protein
MTLSSSGGIGETMIKWHLCPKGTDLAGIKVYIDGGCGVIPDPSLRYLWAAIAVGLIAGVTFAYLMREKR